MDLPPDKNRANYPPHRCALRRRPLPATRLPLRGTRALAPTEMSAAHPARLPKGTPISRSARPLLPRESQCFLGLARRSGLSTESRLDRTMRLINGHEDFVGIVLAKPRKVHQQAVNVGQRQFDVLDFR